MNTINHGELRKRFNPDGSVLRRQQLRMLDMLKFIDDVCKKHDIKYWLSSGTLLGAVRHGGFIPWDDDLDIEMLKGDYRKLMKILRKMNDERYVLQTHETDPDYIYPYAKLRDRHSLVKDHNIYEKRYKYNGIFIDIFPLEPSSSLALSKTANFLQFFFLSRIALLHNKFLRKCLFPVAYAVVRHVLHPCISFLSKIGAKGQLRHAQGSFFWNVRNVEDIFPLQSMDFEGTPLPVPCHVDRYLSKLYGDYMTLPDLDGIEPHLSEIEFKDEDSPLVSVLMPVYNAQETVIESLNSIINQTYQNLEIIVINDGSSDESERLVRSLTDKRITIYANDTNRGIIKTLNRGLQLARGKYIARMDADDISLPTRIEEEVKLMEQHPEVVVCGTDIELFSDTGRKLPKPFLVSGDSRELKSRLAVATCFAHPSVIIRKSVLDKHRLAYDSNYLHAEDYKMWLDLSPYGEFHFIRKKLLRYRISDTQISQRANAGQMESTNRCRLLYVERNLGKAVAERIKQEGVTLPLIEEVRKQTANRYLLELLYLSLPHYGGREVRCYIASSDCFRLGWAVFLRFMKRLLLRPDPVFRQIST